MLLSRSSRSAAQDPLERVVLLVRNAWRWLRWARALEAGFLALAVWFVLASVALLARAFELEAGLAAGVAALALALSYWIARRSDEREVALRIDRGLALQGELLTTWEQARASARTPLVELLARRLGGRVDRGACARVSAPNSLPFLALPLLALALFASVRGRLREPEDRQWTARLAQELAHELEQSARLGASLQRAGELSNEDLSHLEEAAQAARSRRLEAERGDLDASELSAAAAGAEQLAEELLRHLDPTSALAERLAEVADTAAVARQGAELASIPAAEPEQAPPEGQERLAPLGAEATGEARSEPLAGGRPEPGGRGEAAAGGEVVPGQLENGLAGDRMRGSTSAPTPERPTPDAPAVRAERRGVAGGLPWEPRHAAVVERWIEERRARLEGQARDPVPESQHE